MAGITSANQQTIPGEQIRGLSERRDRGVRTSQDRFVGAGQVTEVEYNCPGTGKIARSLGPQSREAGMVTHNDAPLGCRPRSGEQGFGDFDSGCLDIDGKDKTGRSNTVGEEHCIVAIATSGVHDGVTWLQMPLQQLLCKLGRSG